MADALGAGERTEPGGARVNKDIKTLSAPLLGGEAQRVEATHLLRAELDRVKTRCGDMEHFITMAAHHAKTSGAVVLRIDGELFRLTPDGGSDQ